MSSKAADVGAYSPIVDKLDKNWFSIDYLLPALAAIVGATALSLFRLQGSTLDMLKEASLTNLALITYLAAALFYGMYLIGREPMMRKMGMFAMSLGFTFNLAAWGVRWIEYAEFTKAQGDMAKIWPTLSLAKKINHTFPLSNLYDITLGLTTFMGLTSVLLGARKKYDFIGSVTTPIAALFLILAVFLGNDISQPIQPILRSYWRPIHVGVAALSYGVCSVTFAIGILYVLKDKLRPERLALFLALFGVAIYLLVAGLFGNFSLTSGSFGMNIAIMAPKMGEMPIKFSGARGDFLLAEFPYIGRLLQLEVLLFLGAIGCYLKDIFIGEDATFRKYGTKLFALGVSAQVAAVGMLYYWMKTTTDLRDYISAAHITKLQGWLSAGNGQLVSIQQTQAWLAQNYPSLKVHFGSNPIVSAAFFVVIFGGLFFGLMMFYGDKILSNLPSLEILDDLNYKLVSVCFPGFTLMLILGAVWANESWGTYWSWDPKETWGLVTWLAYAGFLHTRFTHGWKGRKAAYFAIVGFLFMLFTYLGVSYLLPGLHSYA